MIELRDIRKQYKTGNLTQQALDGVSLCFREHELVSILGPSGSGKTTLLNILGGLDRYDSGDLVVDGVSTRKFKDRDWDTYRNNTIGFIFQSYNLISHQSILANVELALTISGVSKFERRRRAKEALEQVGLGKHIHKRPAQLSGGQMQRVAIARALINDPRVILADEPTGALDSETSVQIMNILKEVSKEHLVVMVTHNADLAEEYSDRIVSIKDGKIHRDTDPFEPIRTDQPKDKAGGRKAGMNFLTALSLSFQNLRTKKKRSALVSIAGSIGLIGIAVVLALTNGVNSYIQYVEESTVLKYPITVSESGIDYSSYMTMYSEMENEKAEDSGTVKVNQILHSYAGGLTSNDLEHLMEFLESGESDIKEYTAAIEYSYEVIPRIYRQDTEGTRQVHPDQSLDEFGMSFDSAEMLGIVSFYQLPQNSFLYEADYDLKAGHWPQNENEAVLVLDKEGRVTDGVLYACGLRDNSELDNLVTALISGESVSQVDDMGIFQYEDFLNVSFKVTNAGELYSYDQDNNVWIDRSDDEEYLNEVLEKSRDLKIAGVVQEKADSEEGVLSSGIYYSSELVSAIMEDAANSDIVKEQLKNPDINVFTGVAFGENKDTEDMNLGDLFQFDESALKDAFSTQEDGENSGLLSGLDISGFDLSGIDLSDLDLSEAFDLSSLGENISFSEEDLKKIISSLSFDVSAEDAKELFQEILDGYLNGDESNLIDTDALLEILKNYLQSDRALSVIEDYLKEVFQSNIKLPDTPQEDMTQEELAEYYAELIRQELANLASFDANELGSRLAKDFSSYLNENISESVENLVGSFGEYLSQEEIQEKLMSFVVDHMDTSAAQEAIQNMIEEMSGSVSAAMEEAVGSLMNSLTSAISEQIGKMAEQYAQNLSSSMNLSSILGIDQDTLTNAISVSMSAQELQKTLAAFISGSTDSYENNLETLGYADLSKPSSIKIYPKDFDGKSQIETILTDYNTRMEESGYPERAVDYNDIAGFMMSSVQQIINVVSTVMIALVAISLIVSSIMIGVLTHISVLERRKEIGILRAIGASKRNISQIFNAENFITGFASGMICIIGANLLLIPVNWIIHGVIGRTDVSAVLGIIPALLLLLLGIGLNLISGLYPAKKAAGSDPVAALRDE